MAGNPEEARSDRRKRIAFNDLEQVGWGEDARDDLAVLYLRNGMAPKALPERKADRRTVARPRGAREARELMQALHPLLGLEQPPANDRLCGTIGMDLLNQAKRVTLDLIKGDAVNR
jgi:hypothetical protein